MDCESPVIGLDAQRLIQADYDCYGSIEFYSRILTKHHGSVLHPTSIWPQLLVPQRICTRVNRLASKKYFEERTAPKRY